MQHLKMDIFKWICCIGVILLRSAVLSEFVEDQIDCSAIQCQPIQCPDDSVVIYDDDPNNGDYDVNHPLDEGMTINEEMDDGYLSADTLDAEEEDENIVKVEHQNRRHIISSRFYVEPSEKDGDQENRTLVKRSLQYKRRESIKIVPGDYKSLIPDDGRYHGYHNHNHHKWKREVVETNSNATNCCPAQKCICRNSCDIPICLEQQVLIEIKPGHQDQPGDCCPLYKCIAEPDCKQVNVTNATWIEPCKNCQCLATHKICHNTCGDEHEKINTCFSSILKRLFNDNDTWFEGECTHCQCHAGERKCQASLCRPLECRDKIKIPGECCPVCAPSTQHTPMTFEEISPDLDLTTSSSGPQANVLPPTIEIGKTSSDGSSINDVPASTLRTRIEDSNPVQPPCSTDNDRRPVIHASDDSEPDFERIILYAIISGLVFIILVFVYLYIRLAHQKKSYGPVPNCDTSSYHAHSQGTTA